MQSMKIDLGVDVVSRQAVIDSLYDWSNHSMTDAETWHLRQVIGDIKSMPSVTPQEPKKGHWIPTYGNVKCSVCGSVKDSREVGKATHYCDFCGARMVEPQEGEKI